VKDAPRSLGAKQGQTRHYAYLIESHSRPDKHYVGYTGDLRQRVIDQNADKNTRSAFYRPWRLQPISPCQRTPKRPLLREASKIRLRPRFRQETTLVELPVTLPCPIAARLGSLVMPSGPRPTSTNSTTLSGRCMIRASRTANGVHMIAHRAARLDRIPIGREPEHADCRRRPRRHTSPLLAQPGWR
jgi:predicted GIY-YIG superfamily endonuclease